MLLRFTKSKHPVDASAARRLDTLTCARDDGTTTMSKFRATHDLVHYAVETELDIPDSFYRLIAAGLDIEAFNQPGAAQALALPNGAKLAEAVVSLFEMERISFTSYSEQLFNQYLQSMCVQGDTPFSISRATLTRIRARIADLFRRWSAVMPGESLELYFPPEPSRDGALTGL